MEDPDFIFIVELNIHLKTFPSGANELSRDDYIEYYNRVDSVFGRCQREFVENFKGALAREFPRSIIVVPIKLSREDLDNEGDYAP